MLDHLTTHFSLVSASLLFAWWISKLLKPDSRGTGLPPGPPTVPILGNLTILPTKSPHIKFTEWARQYGGIYSLKVASKTMIVLSSIDTIYDIMEKNGAITSNRPHRVALTRIFGQDGSMAISMYGPSWKAKRRAAAEILKPSACNAQIPVHTAETSQLLYDIHRRPEGFFGDIERSIISTILSVVFGIRAAQNTTPVIQKYLHYNEMIFCISQPGNIPPVDLIPLLKYLPDRLARNWKARCDAVRKVQRELFFGLLEAAEKRQKNGTQNGCCLEDMINRATELGLNRDDVAYTAGNFISGATHIGISYCRFLVKLAVIYPEVQRKVHEELDRVVGSDRAPTLDDMPNLPYFNAFAKEVYRFSTPAPLTLPHCANEEQIYNGYVIPKGATIHTNIWGVFRDPDLFESPETFDPERYIRSPQGTKDGVSERYHPDALRKLDSIQFGVGRRFCPGSYLGNHLTSLVTSNLLWAFEFSPAKDELGRDITLDIYDVASSVTNDPLPFKCNIKPRSRTHSQVIIQDYINSTPIFEKFEREQEETDKAYVQERRSEASQLLRQF